ncbi:hypothetical protein [Paenibacillus hexagrammi]|uniref:YesK-like protein n=1 Tax=Paenibacillus hexagrammi TaxID=2908839 RepID=A0ABY3SK51_9BACL|nr:hypothetical protein [Paenibacillus sp. YPD9-1]UJF33868.1 hypothetical protein L0M14_00970 [Paenibacillus sp. YPD9-1]
MDTEAIVNFSALILALVISIGFVLVKVRKSYKRSTLILQSLGLGFLLFAAASLSAFFVYTDALNILVFWVIYLIAYVISSLINVTVIWIKDKKRPTLQM